MLGATVSGLALLLLAGCSGSGVGSSGASDAELAAPATAVDEETARQVVTTASTSLVVDAPADAAQEVSELAEDAGGRVDQRSEQTLDDGAGGESAVADLVLRVPSDELTDLLADLADLGEVDDVSVTRSDVTATAVDLDARISALQTSVTRLGSLMAGATTTDDLLAAEQVLSDRQGELESMQAQRADLADQVELSTLQVHLAQEPAGTAGPDGFLGGLQAGWLSLVTALGALVVVLGVLLPWLVVGGVLTAAVLVPLRRARRRTAPAPQAPPR